MTIKVNLMVGVWLPSGDRPVVLHVDGQLGRKDVPSVHFVKPQDSSPALVLDLRAAGKALSIVRCAVPANLIPGRRSATVSQ